MKNQKFKKLCKKSGKMLSLLMAAAVFLSQPVQALASVSLPLEEDPGIRFEKKQEIYDVTPDTNLLEGWPQGPNVNAAAAIVMDMDSGAILYGKQINEKHYPASITKLLTALVALENAKLDDRVLFSQESIDILEYGDAHIGMKPGEEISMEDALYAVLLASANEVSYAVAENIGKAKGGGYDTFIRMMNEKAAEIGCTGSHWANPHGLFDAQHYTTAHDMACIASEVYKYEEFRKITQTLEHRIGVTAMTNEERVFQQNHDMLWPGNQYYYEYCTGGKTGYVDQSGTTLVTMTDNGTMKLAVVVLQDYGGDSYVDTRAMVDYVYGNFTKVPIAEAGISEDIEKFQDPDAYVVLPQGITVSQLDADIQVESEQMRLGTVVYRYKGQEVGKANVTLTKAYFGETEPILGEGTPNEEKETGQEVKENKKGHPVLILVVIAAAVLIFYIICVRQRRAAMRRRAAARRRMMKNRQSQESGRDQSKY